MSTRPHPALSALFPLLCAVFLQLCAARPLQAQQAAEEQYRFLAGLVEKGMHELAVQEAQKFLRDFPAHPKVPLARYRLAGALWELGRHDEAAREYDTLGRLDAFEYQAECWFRCGEAAVERGDEARARAAFDGVLRGKQEYLKAPAHFALGEAALRARQFDRAEASYTELLRSYPESEQAPLARRALVWCSSGRGDTPRTIERARSFLERKEDPALSDEVRLLLGEALLAAGDPRAALETFRTVQTREQADARARGEGFALAALGKHDQAAKAFESLLGRTPASRFAREASLQAGIERLRAGDAGGAVERLAAIAASGDPEALYWLAQAQKAAGDTRAALASLDKALAGQPEDELQQRCHVLRGDCLAAEGREDEALAAYERSGSDQALHAGAVAALNQGDAAGAMRLAKRVLEGQPDAERARGARLVLAEALFAQKQLAEAERAFAEVLAAPGIDGESAARCRSRLAWCRYLASDRAAARGLFQELVERHASSPEAEEALAMLVQIAVEEHDPAGARAPARRYLELYPRGRSVDQVLLAVARSTQGEDARARYEEFLKRCPESPLRASALLELGELESAAGRHEQAAGRFRQVLGLSPGAAEGARAAYGLAWCSWEQEHFAECEQPLQDLLRGKECPAALRAAGLELLVSVRIELGALARARESWQMLAQLPGEEKRAFDMARTLVRAFVAAGDLAAAKSVLAECTRALRDPALAAAATLESAYLALEGQDLSGAASAIAAARKAGAAPAEVAEASFHLGDARLAAGQADEALTCFQAGVAADNPRAADSLYKLGLVQLQRGELADARRALDQLVAGKPSRELGLEAQFLLGEVAYRAGELEQALARFSAVLQDAAGELQGKALFRAGLAAGRLQRWSEAEAHLARLASSFPSFPNLAEAELWRGRALSALKKTRPARAAFERTLALDQGELAAGARLGLGALLEGEGRVEDALSEYLKVALLYAHEESVGEALYRAGHALEALGDPAKAAERYRELCSQHPRSSFRKPAEERLRALEQKP